MNYTGRFDATFDHEGAAAPSHAYAHVVSSQVHAPADAIIIPDAQLLFRADYKKSGADLILSGDHHEFVVHDYFRGAHRSALASPDGAHLTAEIVRALVGEVDVAQAAGNPAAGQVIGHVTKLQGSATVIRNGVSVILNMGDNVEKGDVVQTGSSSTCGITFIDGTVFGLSSNARMVLNEMVYDPNGSSNSSLLSLVAGTITFVAGETAKHGDMKIDTPVATMGIRGTAVLVEIDFSVPGSNQSPGQQSQPAPSASFQVLVEPDGTTGSYILFDKTTLQPIAIVNQAGQQININNGVISQTTTPLSPDVQKLITDVFQQKFTDNSNTKTTAPFNDSITPTSGPVIVKTADNSHVTATTVTANLGGSITPQTQSAPTLGVQHVAGAPTVTIGDLFNHLTTSFTTAELGAHTGSTLPDGAAGNIAFHDINAGDLPTVRSDFFSVTYTNAIGSYTLANGQASPPPGLSNLQMHDILATEVDLSLVPAGNNANDGSALFFYSIADKAFDFLAKGEKLTLTYDITVNNNYAQFPEKTVVPITITITGANDAPVISTPAQTIAISAGTGTEGGPLKSDNPTSGTFAFADVDLTDTHKVSVELTDQVMSNKGSIPQLPEQFFKNALVASIQTDSTGTGNGVVHWQFGGDPSDLNDPANLPVYLADFIPVGQTLTLTYTITLTDSSGDLTTDSTTQTVTVTITGTAPASEVWIHTTDDGHDNLWTDGLNWETGNAPASTDDVIIITDQLHPHTPAYPATIADGDTAQANSVTMNDFSDPSDSAHESPELDVQSGGSLTIGAATPNPNASGALSLSADSILNNAGTVTVDGDVAMLRTLDPHGNPVVNKAKIANSGTFTIDGGATLQDYAHLSNSGTMTIAGSLGLLNLFDQDGSLVSLNGSVIDNSGTLNLDSGGTFQGHARFANDGTVTAEGAMNWLDLLDADGNLVSLNQGVICNSGTLTLGQGGQLQGLISVTNTGTIDVTGGTLGVLVDVANTHGEIDGQITVEKGATLALGSDMHNTSVHGGITGGTVTIKGVLDLQGSNFLSDGTLVNTGNIGVVSTGNSLDGETVNNLDGTITVTGTLLLDDGTTISGGDLTNSGTLQIESASGASLNHVNVDNSGGAIAVDCDSSPVTVTLTLDDGTTITNGQLNIGSAGVLEISPETGATLDDVSVSNSGNIQIDEGATLLLDDGTVISGGSLSNSGTLQIESADGATLDNVGVDNSGDIIAVDCDSSPDTVTLTLSDGTTVTGGNLSVGEVGILEISGDTGATLDGVSVSNSGLVEIGDGSTLLLNDGTSISGGSLGNGGTLQVDGATFDNVSVENADGTIEIEDGSTLLLEDGTTILDGNLSNSGTLQIESLAGAMLDNVNVDNSDGTIAVDCESSPDTVTLTLSDGTVVAGGSLSIGSVGILEVSGDDGATLDSVTVNNSGNIQIDDGATLLLDDGTTIISGNLANAGILDIETSGGATLDGVNVDNSGGNIEVDDPTSPATVTLTLDDGASISNGTITVGDVGIVDISGDTAVAINNAIINSTGVIQVDDGATLNLDGSTVNGGTITDNGTVVVDKSTTLKLNGTALSGGKIDNAGTVEIIGSGSIENGILANAAAVLLIDANQTLTLDGTTITGGAVTNNGTVNVDADTTLTLNTVTITGGSVTNAGTIASTGGGAIDNADISNTGTIESTVGVMTIDPAGPPSFTLINSGLVQANGGELDITGEAISNSGTVQAVGDSLLSLSSLTLTNSGNGHVSVEKGSTLDLSDSGISGGRVTISGTLESHGTSFVDAAITNNGGIEVMSGLLTLSGSINGTGSATIDAYATLELNLDDTQSVVFNGAGAELKLDGLHLTGAITGFAATDKIDLGGIAYGAATTATYNAETGVLSISDGNGGHIDLNIGAGYSGAHFAGGSDNDGGALITLNAGDGAPAFTQGSQTASFHEQPNVTGSSSLDPASPDAPASGTLTFTDIDLTDRPTVSIGTQTVVWTAADGHTDLSASLTSDQISALEQALTLTPAAGNANNGSVGWNYSIADSALDFLGAGQTLTVTSNATVDDHQGGTASAPITITISGADDAPSIAYGGTSPVSTGEGAPVTINGLSVADVDGGNGIEQLTLSVGHGAITFDGQTGSSLTISGTIANLDAALANGVTYTAADGYSGSDALQVAINDQAPNGAALSASTSVAISVAPDVLTANDDAIANAAPPSGSGWVLDTENGHYYRLVTTTLSWSDANAQAQADGTYLATITSADEQAFVAPLAAGDRAWLGGGATDDATGTGHFVWLTGPEAGTPFDYTHWRAGEPNGGFGSTEYVHIEGVDDAANGGWNDAPDAAGGRDFIEEWGGLSGQIAFNENTGTTIAESVLLANDTDSLLRTFSITGVSAASAHGGTVTLDGHSIDYTPAADFSGADSFTYTISDGVTTSTGTVSFNVAASEQGPSDNAPTITSGPQTANVADGGVFSASGRLTAADPDFGDTLSWSIDGGSSVVSQDFDYGLHELKVVKNSTLIFDDTYNGTAPPNGPNFLVGNTNPPVYALSGGSIAPGGPGSPALLEGATAAPVGLSLNPASYDQIVYGPFATLLTNNTPGLTNGLRSNESFSASATFDLDDPLSTSTRYGIRFSDRQSTPGANGTPAQPGTETVDLTVEHNAGGSMSVMLDEINFETGVATALQTIPIVTGHNDNEIVLKLSNSASNNGNVVASYQLMYQNADGREVADGSPVVFSQTGRIFDNEDWTHVQVYGQSLAVPETTSTPSDVAANAVSYLQGTYGTLAVNESNGTWQYYLNPGLASVKALAQGQTAHDIFSVTVTDASGQHGSAPVDITVTGINDAPTASYDGSNPVSADQGTPVLINGLSVADVDGGSSLEQLTLSVAHGTITFDGQTGASITISDTLADLNAALAHGVSYSSAAGYSGSDALQVTINDEAANGHALSASTSVAISVPSSGPPLVTITVDTPDGMNFQDNHGPLTEMGKAALQEGATATTFTLVDTADNVSFVVDGSGFSFDGNTVTGGTLTSFHEFSADGSTALADFTGFSVDAATWMADVQQAAGGDSSAIDALTSTFAYDFIGGAGPDTFGIGAPAGSHSTLTGGGGADTFEYDAGFGAVTITDFDQGNSGSFDHTKGDKIDLFGFSGKPTISYVNGNTVADFGNGDVLTLLNVNPDNLNNSDFNSNGGNNGGGNDHGPVVNNAGNNVTYNGSPVMIDPAVTVTDSSSSIESVNVWISSGYRSGDALTIGGNTDGNLNEADGTTIHYHFDPVAGGIFLQATGGTPSFADFDAALEQIQFSTASNDPTAGGTDSSRSISWAAHDNADQFSQTPTTTVNIDIIPVLNSMTLNVTQGGITELTNGEFNVTDPGVTNFTYSVFNVTGGQFEVFNGTDWVAAPTGGFTTAQIAAGFVEFVADGSANAPTFKVQVSDGHNVSAAISPTVNFNLAAETVHWINANGGDFHTASNWDVNQVPGSNADVAIDATPNFPAVPSYGVSLTSDATIHSLDVAPFAILGIGGVALNAAGNIDVAGALFGTGLITADSLTVQTTDNVSEGTLPPTTFAGAVGANGGALIIDTGAFSNQGSVLASEGTLQIGNIDGSTDITNLQTDADHAGGVVLTGGAYMASGFTGNTPTSIVFESSSPITTLDASVTLFGASTIISDDTVLQDSLQKIGEGGALSLGATLNSVASFADSNAVDVSGAIHLQGGSFSAASLTIETGGVVDGYGQLQAEHNDSFGGLTNNGTIFASGGAVNPGDSAVLEIAGHIDGTGMLEIGGASQDGILQIDPVETALVNGTSQSVVSVSGQTVQFDSFHGQASQEQLIVGGAEVDSNTFNASINGFAAGDTIDLTGVGVADHWSFDGAMLTITSDGSTLATLNFTGLSDSTVFSVNADQGGAGTTIGIVPPPHPAPTIDTSDFTLSQDDDVTAIQGLQVEDNDSSVSSFTLTTSTGDAPESSVMPSSASGDLAIINDAVSSVVYNPGANPPQADQVNLTVSDNFGDSSTVHFVFNEAGTGPNITLTGTPGNDVIFATGQPDTLTGNGGQDQFVFKPSSPTDTVTVEHTIADFNVNLDTIDLRQLSNIGSAGDVLTTAIQHGSDTLLTLDDHQTLLLKNVIPTQLHTNDFIIAPH